MQELTGDVALLIKIFIGLPVGTVMLYLATRIVSLAVYRSKSQMYWASVNQLNKGEEQ